MSALAELLDEGSRNHWCERVIGEGWVDTIGTLAENGSPRWEHTEVRIPPPPSLISWLRQSAREDS